MAISDHRSKASLRNYISPSSSEQLRACSDILSDALSGWPHQSQQLSLTALSSRVIFMFLRISRLSFIHKTHALSSLFSNCHEKKLAGFYEPQFGRISLNISLSDSVLKLETFGESVKFDLPKYFRLWTIADCELRGFDTFDGFCLVQPIKLFEPF